MENRIGELRRERGLTLKQLGKILNVRDNALSQYETGKRNPQLGLLEEIADYFNVSIEYLDKSTDKRDYPMKSDDDAINLLTKIKNNEINYHNLSKATSLELALWIINNEEKIKALDNDNKGLTNTAYFFIHQLSIDSKVLREFSKDRIKDNKNLDKIDEMLLFDDNYFGANIDDVLTFMKESSRIGYDQTQRIISEMKKMPTFDYDEN